MNIKTMKKFLCKDSVVYIHPDLLLSPKCYFLMYLKTTLQYLNPNFLYPNIHTQNLYSVLHLLTVAKWKHKYESCVTVLNNFGSETCVWLKMYKCQFLILKKQQNTFPRRCCVKCIKLHNYSTKASWSENKKWSVLLKLRTKRISWCQLRVLLRLDMMIKENLNIQPTKI